MHQIESLLVTGSNGFVGKSFLEFLAHAPLALRPRKLILINRSKSNMAEFLESQGFSVVSIQADLSKKWTITHEATHVLNLAADGGMNAYSHKSSKEFIEICRNLSNWVRNNRPTVVVHASSGACFYKDKSTTLFKNKINLIESRLEGENLLLLAGSISGTKIVAARLFTFLGKNMLDKKQYAAPTFISEAVSAGSINVTGNSNTIRSYLHERVMSEWIYECLTNNELEEILSIGSSKPVTIHELADFIGFQVNSKVHYSNSEQEKTVYLPAQNQHFNRIALPEGPSWQEIVLECIRICKKRSQNFD
jgi:nucleoside-diphosphate-sugar epimerase